MPKRSAAAAWRWPQELRGALNATAAMLPFVLSYGFIAFGALGTAAGQAGLSAAVVGVVLGGLLLALVSRLPLPSASPSASTCTIVASAVLVWMQDPALQPGAPGGLAALLALVGCSVSAAGLLQLAMGGLRAGRLVRFVPRPVLAGFMNGVAVLIVLSQLGPALGLPAPALSRDGLAALAGWQPQALALTIAAAAVVWAAGRRLPQLPATLLALLLGTAAALLLPARIGPLQLPDVPRIGALQADWPLPLALAPLLGADGLALLQRHGATVLQTALLIALIGALESVLNLATVDPQTRRRSDPDRAIASLGLVNLVLGSFGALPVVYLRIRAMATLAGGGRTPRSLVAGSLLLALVFTLGLPLVALCPKPVVAGVVIMLAWTLVDPWSLALLRRRPAAGPADGAAMPGLPETGGVAGRRRLSLAVMAAVGLVTVLWGFVAGVALGVLLSLLLLVRALNLSLVRQCHTAAEIPSRRVYPAASEALLAGARRGIAVLELEGALFFGNVDRLELAVRALLPPAAAGVPLQALVLDLRRVSTLDASGAVMLESLQALLAARGCQLLLAGVTADNPHGQSLRAHGVIGTGRDDAWALHADADLATEAAEQAALATAAAPPPGAAVALADCALLAGLDADGLARVAALLRPRQLAAGERLFAQDDPGQALYLLVAGSVSVVDRSRRQRFVSFSPGMTFGETALLDGRGRTADAIADMPSTVHALDVAAMAQLEREAPALATRLYRNLSLHLATRLREAADAWRRAAG